MSSGKPASVAQMGGMMQARVFSRRNASVEFRLCYAAIGQPPHSALFIIINMRRRFFVDQVRNGHAQIADEDAKHLTRVLRVEVGQRYEISDNRAVYLAEIETARKELVVFRTLERIAAPGPAVRTVLFASLIKFDHFEWMIEKATELGVARIV